MMIEMKNMSQNVNNVAESFDIPTYKPKSLCQCSLSCLASTSPP